MGLLSFLKKKRYQVCPVCKRQRAVRFCLKQNKKLCWHDCNVIRATRNCPEQCKYALKSGQGQLAFTAAVDSTKEYADLQRILIDEWLISNDNTLDGIPVELAQDEANKKRLLTYLATLQGVLPNNTNYLYQRLGLPAPNYTEPAINPEDLAATLLEHLLLGNWNELIKHLPGKHVEQPLEVPPLLMQKLQDDKLLGKSTNVELVSTASNKEGGEVIVHFETSAQTDLCLHLYKTDTGFVLQDYYHTTPQVGISLAGAENRIGALLSKGQAPQAGEFINQYLPLFPVRANLNYYQALLHTMQGKDEQAQQELELVRFMDPGFPQVRLMLGFFYQKQGNNDIAKQLYQQELEMFPNSVAALNNLAVLEKADGNLARAKQMWQKCVELEKAFVGAYSNLANLEIDEQNYAKARQLLQQGLQQQPENEVLQSQLKQIDKLDK